MDDEEENKDDKDCLMSIDEGVKYKISRIADCTALIIENSIVLFKINDNDLKACILNFENKKIVDLKLQDSKLYIVFNLSSSKKFIITRQMWKIFKTYLPLIEKVLTNGK